MNNIKLIALDMDGTLFNSSLQISEANRQIIKKACDAGVEVVISTGRPYCGFPTDLLSGLGVNYAITVNGAALYKLPEKKCLYEDCMDLETFLPIARMLQKRDVLFHVFIDGLSYFEESKRSVIDKMDLPDIVRDFLHNSGVPVDDIVAFLEKKNASVQKACVNFYPISEDVYQDYDEIAAYLRSNPSLSVACGGYHNLEFARKGLNKATGLKYLADYLHIPMEQVMACGDSENDIEIVETAGIGVAMANAEPEVKKASNYISLTNDEDGVAYAIKHFLNIQ